MCEGIVKKRSSDSGYRYSDPILRQEAVGIATNMLRLYGQDIDDVEPSEYVDAYDDVGFDGQATWVE